MTDDPPDPAYRQAAAAYRSAGNLRSPPPAPQIVRLIEQPGALPAPQAAPPNPPFPLESGQQGDEAPGAPQGAPAPASASASVGPSAKGMSLMITNAQKDSLRQLGISEDEIRDMTPTEAHRRLGLSER